MMETIDISGFIANAFKEQIGETDANEIAKKIEGMTAKDYFNLNCAERFELNIQLAFLEKEGLKDVSKELHRLGNDEVRYKYLFKPNSEERIFFKDAEEVKKYFGYSVHSVWRLMRERKFEGHFERVNCSVFYDREGNVLGEVHRKVPTC